MSDLFTSGSILLAIAGALAFYLAAPGQRWLRAPLAPRLFRTIAATSSILAVVIGANELHPATSLAIVFTAAMACLTACPFIGVLVQRTRFRGASR